VQDLEDAIKNLQGCTFKQPSRSKAVTSKVLCVT